MWIFSSRHRLHLLSKDFGVLDLFNMGHCMSGFNPLYIYILSAGTVEYADCNSTERLDPSSRPTCWSWVVICNASWRDLDGWAIRDSVIEVVTWLAILHVGPYWTRRAFGEVRSNQSAGHVKLQHQYDCLDLILQILENKYLAQFYLKDVRRQLITINCPEIEAWNHLNYAQTNE